MSSETSYYNGRVLREGAASTPTQLEYVEFRGIKRTKYDALVKEITVLFNSRTLDELVIKSEMVATHMMQMGLFKRIVPLIDTNDRHPNAYSVEFLVSEPRHFTLGANGGLTNNGEANASLNFDQESAFGRGETVTACYTHGLRGTSSFNISLNKPFLGWQRFCNIGASVHRRFALHPWTHLNDLGTGVGAEIRWHSFGPFNHSLTYSGEWRHIRPTIDAAFAVREQAGHSIKSSIEHIVSIDTRDCSNLPKKGLLFKLANEHAGYLGGDVGFFRTGVDLQANTSLRIIGNPVLSVGLSACYIRALRGRTLHLLDRTYLGGPANLRGFELNSVGPRVENSFMGGMASWVGAIHIFVPLKPVDMVYGHLFGVVGAVHGVRHNASLNGLMQRLTDSPNASLGVGIAVKVLDSFRIELNYVVPMRYSSHDRVRSGFQFGAGVSFL